MISICVRREIVNWKIIFRSGMIVICWPGIVLEKMMLTDEALGGR